MEFRAIHKKEDGTASLMPAGLEWRNANGSLVESIPWARVKDHKYSAAHNAKASP